MYLADTSALARLRLSEVAAVLIPLIEDGLVARCGPIDLEILFTARSQAELEEMRKERALAFPLLPVTQGDFDRAADVMGLLAAAGLHRSAKAPDLLIAAIAERTNVTLLHYDADFDHIASVTGQKMEWVVPRGSLGSA